MGICMQVKLRLLNTRPTVYIPGTRPVPRAFSVAGTDPAKLAFSTKLKLTAALVIKAADEEDRVFRPLGELDENRKQELAE